MFYFDYIKMTHHIPDEIINKIVLMARPTRTYIRQLSNIGKIVEYKTAKGNGNCRAIDYIAHVGYYMRVNKLKTRNHYSVLYQLKRLIISYNIEKEISDDFGDISLGEWYKWYIYEDMFYTSGDENYESDDY